MASTAREDCLRRFGAVWLALTAALGLHVADEAVTGFLAVYNPAVAAIRARAPLLPLPTFSFGSWLALLVVAIMLLLAVSPLAFRGGPGMRSIAFVYGGIMLANGLGHTAGSLLLGRLLPGVVSSPLLSAAAIWLLVSAYRLRR